MNEIVMLPIDELYHHPENPRQDLGDLEELADSIKANGVMQNLTVVPNEGGKGFLVIIGNRRLGAARMAGLTELPCVVSSMDHKAQISTMLMENMQRQDLTLYEQAKGFQMMMDLGFTTKEIGEKTGFSEKTVKDRIKLTKLNQKNFEKAVSKGVTLLDLLEVSKLEKKADQNAVLAEAGTSDFRQMLKRKLSEQKFEKGEAYLKKIAAEEGFETLPEGKSIYGSGYQWTDHRAKSSDPEDKVRRMLRKARKENPEIQMIYIIREDWHDYEATITVLIEPKKKTDGELTEEALAEKKRKLELQKKSRNTRKMWAEAYRLRLDFVQNYTVGINGTGMTNIAKLIVKYSLGQKQKYGRDTLPENQHWKGSYIREALGLQQEAYEDKKSILELMEGRDVPMIRAAIAWIMGGGVFDCDSEETGFYDSNDGSYCPESYFGIMLKERYEFLMEIGYEMSTLEIQLMNGTHECYGGLKNDKT